MATILVATSGGCRVFASGGGELAKELVGLHVGFLAREPARSCLAILNDREIWRREILGAWSMFAKCRVPLQSLASGDGLIFAGGLDEALLLRFLANGKGRRLVGFDATPGRGEWFAGGPPLGVRSLAVAADGAAGVMAVLAAVHVGGIPRSLDRGLSWAPTIPVMFDVHELSIHPGRPGFVAAACAVGLAVSHDGGLRWSLITEGLDETNSLAVAALAEEVLFSIQDGPFAKRSQIWRWRQGARRAEQVRDGLPEWLEGKVDTGHIAAGGGRAAVVDGGGNLWLSREGSVGWERIAGGLGSVFGVAIVG
jgi:hypothetical protein